MNAFESAQQKVIPAVLIYLFFEDEVLMLHRNNKEKANTDIHYGKWNGLGGKLDLNESPTQAAKREVFEESGITLQQNELKPLGSLYFPNFKAHKKEDWWVSLFRVDLNNKPNIQSHSHTKEGTLQWIPKNELLKLPLWEGDLLFLPYVLNYKPLIGTFWYNSEKKLTDHELFYFNN
jgi:8-oxo-dGTP diphosphatase